MNLDNVINDPRLSGIDKKKLLFISQLSKKANSNNLSELLPFVLAAAGSARQNNISFSKQEKDLLIEVLKQNMSSNEQNVLVKMLEIISQGGKNPN